MLRTHLVERDRAAGLLGAAPDPDGFVFSYSPVGDKPVHPSTVAHRYGRLVERLGIDTTLHSLRHYNATELIAASVDIRTVAGRLGHGGGGATTLRVYAARLKRPASPSGREAGSAESAGDITGGEN